MKTAIRLLGMVWVLPAALPVWLLFILPAWALGFLQWGGVVRFGVVRFTVMPRAPLWARMWRGWGGLALPYAILLNSEAFITELHELRHTDQWLALGALFPFVYGFFALSGGHRDNPFERDARRWSADVWAYSMLQVYPGWRS